MRQLPHARAAVLALSLVLVVFAALAPNAPAVRGAGATSAHIMPLGDSLTDGYNSPGGYRTYLWSKFSADNLTIDFVGSLVNGPTGLGDRDHEGHSGWRIDQIANSAVNWLNVYRPDIVLLLIGTNDMAQGYQLSTAPDRLSALIDQITSTLPDAHVVVSTIPRMSSSPYIERIQAYNSAIPGVVSQKQSAGKKVRLVDMYAVIAPGDLHTDGTHMADSGNRKMADTWYPAIQSILATLPPPDPNAPRTVTFDDLAGQSRPLNGQYPSGTIDWGSSRWWHSSPWGRFTTKSISFNAAGVTSASFTFVSPRRLQRLNAYNGGGSASTVSLSCAGQPTQTVSVAAGALVAIITGWTGTCGTVTVSSSNGWNTNFDDLVHDGLAGPPPPDTTRPVISAVQAGSVGSSGATITWTTDEPSTTQVEYGTTLGGPYGTLTPTDDRLVTSHSRSLTGLSADRTYYYRVRSKDAANNEAVSGEFSFRTNPVASTQTITFDDRAGQNQQLNGQYPSGAIDWGSGKWFHSAPWGKFTTKSISFSNASLTSATFVFVSPKRLATLQAYNGGSGTSTVSLSCAGQPTYTVPVSAGAVVTLTTDWTDTCDTVTVSSSNGWNTNFDNLTYE
jgi:lysophospholipase L1-like esterase